MFLIIVAECIRKQARQRKQQRRTRHHQAGGLSWGAPSIPLDPEAQAERELRRHMTADPLWARFIALSDWPRQRWVTPSPTVVQGERELRRHMTADQLWARFFALSDRQRQQPPYFNVASDWGCGDDLVASSMLVKAEPNDEENESHDEGARRSIGKGWRPRGDGQARRPRGADAAASRETTHLLGDPDLSAAAPPPGPAAAVPALAQLVPMASAPAAPLEDWQEIQSDGSVKCRACSKYADDVHCASEGHVTKLASWRTRREGYPAPRQLYLAYMPWDKNESSNRALKCLLCDKWAIDETAHSDGAALDPMYRASGRPASAR